MGLHTRLARIEEALLKLAKTYDYQDIDFTTEEVSSGRIKLCITAFMGGDPSVGIPDSNDSFVYDLNTQYANEGDTRGDRRNRGSMPTGYACELMGQREAKPGREMYNIIDIADEDIRVCAKDLGNIAARMLFNEVHYEGGKL